MKKSISKFIVGLESTLFGLMIPLGEYLQSSTIVYKSFGKLMGVSENSFLTQTTEKLIEYSFLTGHLSDRNMWRSYKFNFIFKSKFKIQI